MISGINTLIQSSERLWQEMLIHTGNLSGMAATGYRGDRVFTESLQASREATRAMAADEVLRLRTFASFTPGTLRSTGRELDIAIDGVGWLVAETPDGAKGLTRNGMLQLTSEGDLLTGSGYPLLGEGGAITLPRFSQMTIGRNGVINIVPLGSSAVEEAARILLVNPPAEKLSRSDYGLFYAGGELTADDSVALVSGHLEESNVDAISQYVEMVSAGRNLDMHIRIMKTYDDMARSGNQLLHPVPSAL